MANGWLGPEGEFISCSEEKHYLLIGFIMQSLNSDIEQWIHVSPNSSWGDFYPTQAQIDWIKKSNNESYLTDLKMMLEMKRK